MPDVFISYSSKDQVAAHATLSVLEAQGISCWMAPRDIPAGKEWGEGLIDGIEACSLFILLFTENANQSPQVRREVERAVHKGLVVIPVRLEDVMPRKALEYFISSAHWMDAFPEPFEDYLESLATNIQYFRDNLPHDHKQAVSGAPKKNRRFSTSSQWWITLGAASVILCAILVVVAMNRHQKPVENTTPTDPNPTRVAVEAPAPNPETNNLRQLPTTGMLVPDDHSDLEDKLNRIKFPLVNFVGVSLDEAVDFLRQKSRDLDSQETNPELKGVKIRVEKSDNHSAELHLELKNVPMSALLQYVTELAGMKYKLTADTVVIVPISEIMNEMSTRVYPFNSELLQQAMASNIGPVFTAKAWLSAQGIPFPPDASAVFKGQTLIVRNTIPNHDVVGALIDAMYAANPNLVRPSVDLNTIEKTVR